MPVEIEDAAGPHALTVDMRTPTASAQGGIAQWMFLGEYRFEPGKTAWLEIRADGADGVVLADAAVFVPVRD